MSFADKLKKSAAALFGIDPLIWEEAKNDEISFVAVHYPKDDVYELCKISTRTFLQRYGTESHRNIFGDDFWVDALFKDYDPWDGKNYVITDARFPNELRRIKELNGLNLRIVRQETTKVIDSHESEQMPPLIYIDSIVYNDGTFEDLYHYVDNFMRDYALMSKNVAEVRASS